MTSPLQDKKDKKVKYKDVVVAVPTVPEPVSTSPSSQPTVVSEPVPVIAQLPTSPLKMRLWKQAILARYGYRCSNCGGGPADGKILKIVVLRSDKALRYDSANGITLCVECLKKGVS